MVLKFCFSYLEFALLLFSTMESNKFYYTGISVIICQIQSFFHSFQKQNEVWNEPGIPWISVGIYLTALLSLYIQCKRVFILNPNIKISTNSISLYKFLNSMLYNVVDRWRHFVEFGLDTNCKCCRQLLEIL